MKKKLALGISTLILLVLIWSDVRWVEAAEKTEFPFISIDSYSVSKDKIIPGSDFTLQINLKNNSETTSAKNVVVGLSCPSGVSPKYGTPGQAYFKEIPKGENVEALFEFSTIEEIYSYYLDFQVTIFGDESNNSVILRIPVGTDSPFNITNVSIDESGVEGQTISASVAFKVIGIDFVKNVALKAFCDEAEVSSISIGSLAPGTSKTQLISIPLYSFGEHKVDIAISYEDATGKNGIMEVGTQTVEVMRQLYEPTPTPIEKKPSIVEQIASNKKMLAGILGAALILGVSIVWYLMVKKGKR